MPKDVDTLSPKFVFKTSQMLFSALVREAFLQIELVNAEAHSCLIY